MTETEALKVVRLLQAAFHRVDWPKDHIAVWVAELVDSNIGPDEAMRAARAMYRQHDWPSIKAFTNCLAQIRAQRLDHHRGEPDLQRPALKSGDRETPPDEAKRRIAQMLAGIGRLPADPERKP